MVLPVKLQASILSWMGEDSIPAVDYAPERAPDGPVVAVERATTESDWYPALSPTDLFSLSNAAAAAGSPCVVIKDRFLGQEEALRVHEGKSHTLCVENVWLKLLVCCIWIETCTIIFIFCCVHYKSHRTH